MTRFLMVVVLVGGLIYGGWIIVESLVGGVGLTNKSASLDGNAAIPPLDEEPPQPVSEPLTPEEQYGDDAGMF